MNQTNDTNKRIAEASPEELRIRIALHLGARWRRFKDCQIVRLSFNDRAEIVEPERPSIVLFSVTVPNYTESLDAIREAVLAQDEEFQKQFAEALDKIADDAQSYRWIHQLTAADWCAAFLAVLEGRGE